MTMNKPDDLKPPQMPAPSSKSGMNLGGGMFGHIIVIVIAVAFSMILVSMGISGALTKSEFDTQIQGALDAIAQAKTDLTNSQTTLNSAITSMGSSIDTKVSTALSTSLTQINANISSLSSRLDTINTQVQDVINKANKSTQDISTLNTLVANLRVEIDTIKADISSLTDSCRILQSDILALATRVSVLENPPVPPPAVPPPEVHDITLELTQASNFLLPTDNSANSTANDNSLLVGTFKIVLTNTSVNDIEDIIVSVLIQTMPIPDIVMNPTLSSTPVMSWLSSSWAFQYYQYTNSWGLNIQAGKSKTIYFTFTITGDYGEDGYTNPYEYIVEAEIVE